MGCRLDEVFAGAKDQAFEEIMRKLQQKVWERSWG